MPVIGGVRVMSALGPVVNDSLQQVDIRDGRCFGLGQCIGNPLMPHRCRAMGLGCGLLRYGLQKMIDAAISVDHVPMAFIRWSVIAPAAA